MCPCVWLCVLRRPRRASLKRRYSFSQVGSYSLDDDLPHHPLLPVLKDCYSLLSSMARRNADCAGLLRQHINHFLSQAGLGLHASDLVVELVTGNARACAGVAEHHILRAIHRLSDRSPYRRIRRIKFLRSVVAMPDGSLVARNQMLVVRGVCERRSALGLLGRLHTQAARMTLVELADSDLLAANAGSGASEAAYYIHLLRLLALCAPNKLVYRNGMAKREGEEAALLCQAAVSLSGLAHVLRSTKSARLKAAILRFIEQVYGSSALGSAAGVQAAPALRGVVAPGLLRGAGGVLEEGVECIQAIMLDVMACLSDYSAAADLPAFASPKAVEAAELCVLRVRAWCRQCLIPRAVCSVGVVQFGGCATPHRIGLQRDALRFVVARRWLGIVPVQLCHPLPRRLLPLQVRVLGLHGCVTVGVH